MTEYLTIIPELLLSLLHLLIIRKYMKVFWGPENRNLKGYIEWGIYYVFLIINNIGSVFPPHLLLFGNVLLIFMISSATRKRSVMQRCIFSILICTVWMLVEVIVLMILISVGFDSRTLQEAGSFISKMCMLLLSVIISHCIRDNHYSEIPLLYFLSILLIPVSSIYVMHHIFLIAAVHSEYMIFSATASFLLLIVNYVIFEVYDWISRNAELREQNRLYAQQLELCSQQAEERESLYLEIRRIRHDLKNHLSGLLGMVQAGQTSEAEKYIMQMLNVGAGDRPEEVSRSGNIVLDSLINNAYAAAQKDKIQFNVNILVPASLPFESGHLAIVLGYKTQESLTGINEICKETEYCFLNSENSIVKENGIELLEEIYGNLHKFILDNQKKINYQKPFNLFDETIRYVVDAIKEMSPEKVQKCVRWDGFIECVQRITFCMGYDKDNPEVELENTYYFARYAGNYLSMNYDKKYELYWKQILERCFWTYTANIPKEGVEGFLKAQCIVKFNYIYGFIENGLYALVIDSFFCGAMAKDFYSDDKYNVLLGLLVHCYLYYITKSESGKVIEPEMRNYAEKIVLHKEVKRVYNMFISHLWGNSNIFNVDILKQMIKILSPYKRFNEYSRGHLIIENVIKEYYMFITLYLSNAYNMPGLLERNLDDEIYYGYIYENKAESTKQMLIGLYTLIDDRESSEQEISAKVELMYDGFSAFEKRKFKEKQMKKAVQNQIRYIWNIDVDKVKNHIREMVEGKLREKFKEIIFDSDEQGEVIEIPLLSLFDYTDSIKENCADRFCPDMYGQFSLGLEWILKRQNVLDKVDRIKDFADDRDYMNYLQSNNLELLIGSKYVLVNRDYRLTHEFEKLTEDWKVIYTMFMENGLALKKDSIKVCIHSIEVTIRPQSISDEKQNYNEETKLYTYSIYSGMPIDFEEHELEAFLHDNRKIMEISAKVSVKVTKEKIGTLVMGERGGLWG